MILNKAKMAHDYAIEMLKRGDPERGIAFDAWTLADAMQAEEDKRVSKDRPEVLYPLIDWHKYGKGLYHFWAMDEDGQAFWHNRKPKINGGKWDSYHKYKAPTFDYQGNWQDSFSYFVQEKTLRLMLGEMVA